MSMFKTDNQVRGYYETLTEKRDFGAKEQLSYIVLADRFQKNNNIRGSVAEIGVFVGDYYFMLASCARPDEYAVAIDLFENQGANIDGSGEHDKTIAQFQREYDEMFENGSRPRFIQGDSLYLEKNDLLKSSAGQQYRIFSIDGGHTHYHLVNDLKLCEKVLCHGGVVIIDDYTNAGWPEVAEGVARYFLMNDGRRLAPFLINWNKLVLTTESFHRKYYNYILEICQIQGLLHYEKSLYGFGVLNAQGFSLNLF